MVSREDGRGGDGRASPSTEARDLEVLARLLDWAEREARALGQAEAADSLAEARRSIGLRD